MKALLICALAFKLQYVVKFVDSTTSELFDDRMSTHYMYTRTCATYTSFMQFAKLLIKNKYRLPLLESLSEE